MGVYNSNDFCDGINGLGYEGLYAHDRGTETLVVKDNLITTADIAQERAISELLKGGYSQRWVNLTSVHIVGLKQNDIISFKGVLWIIKEIRLDYTTPVLKMQIKGLRYE